MALPPTVQKSQVVTNLLELLGMDGPSRWEVIPGILPVAIVQDTDPAKQEKFAFGQIRIGAVAAQNSHNQIFNPADSGVIVHVDSALIVSGAAVDVEVAEHDTALTTLGTTKGWRDRRNVGAPVAEIRSQTNAGVLSALRRLLIPTLAANDMEPVPLDVWLEPGQGLNFQAQTVNITLGCSIYWDEKVE